MYVRVKDLIAKLKEFDPELPVCLTDDGKGHQYGIILGNIEIKDNPYFGNDSEAADTFDCYDENNELIEYEYLNLGNF